MHGIKQTRVETVVNYTRRITSSNCLKVVAGAYFRANKTHCLKQKEGLQRKLPKREGKEYSEWSEKINSIIHNFLPIFGLLAPPVLISINLTFSFGKVIILQKITTP